MLNCNNEYYLVLSPQSNVKQFYYDSHAMVVNEGYLSSSGNFVCTKNIFTKYNDRPPDAFSGNKFTELPRIVSKPLKDRKPFSEGCYNKPLFNLEPVYEFRSGKLIPGILNANGVFTPDDTLPIIDISKYIYSKTARRVYNLPGKFVTAAEYRKLQEKK